MHTDTDTVTRPVEHAPINWLTTTVFTVTPLAALILVPRVSRGALQLTSNK